MIRLQRQKQSVKDLPILQLFHDFHTKNKRLRDSFSPLFWWVGIKKYSLGSKADWPSFLVINATILDIFVRSQIQGGRALFIPIYESIRVMTGRRRTLRSLRRIWTMHSLKVIARGVDWRVSVLCDLNRSEKHLTRTLCVRYRVRDHNAVPARSHLRHKRIQRHSHVGLPARNEWKTARYRIATNYHQQKLHKTTRYH